MEDPGQYFSPVSDFAGGSQSRPDEQYSEILKLPPQGSRYTKKKSAYILKIRSRIRDTHSRNQLTKSHIFLFRRDFPSPK